jgi:hypothetical protein
MQLSEVDRAKVLAAITLLSERTGTQITMTANETVRDGTCVMLQSPEGWFIDVIGGPLVEGCEYPSLGVKLRGYILNPKRDILEALTLYPVDSRDSVAELDIDDAKFDFAGWAVSNLVPAVRHSYNLVQEGWRLERERAEKTSQLQAHFGMDAPKKKLVVGAHTVNLSVGPSSTDYQNIAMSVSADGLSLEQAEAILKILGHDKNAILT